MNANLIAQRLDQYRRTATPEKVVAEFEALGVKFEATDQDIAEGYCTENPIQVSDIGFGMKNYIYPITLNRISDLKAILEKGEKPEALVYFRMAHYLNIRRQQQRLLVELKNEYPIQFNRTNDRKLLRVKFSNV